MNEFKSKDVTRLLDISENTLRSWRKQGKDFDRVHGERATKDHVYGRRGLLSLAVMQKVKASGASLEIAWQVAFWGAAEVAKWADVWDIPPWAEGSDSGVVISETTKARWAICPMKADQNPIITDNPTRIADMYNPMEADDIAVTVIDLWTLANSLPKDLVAMIRMRGVVV